MPVHGYVIDIQGGPNQGLHVGSPANEKSRASRVSRHGTFAVALDLLRKYEGSNYNLSHLIANVIIHQ